MNQVTSDVTSKQAELFRNLKMNGSQHSFNKDNHLPPIFVSPPKPPQQQP
jgi:hypothetical protein